MSLQQRDSLYYELEQPDDNRYLQNFHQYLRESLIRTDNPVTTRKEEFVPFEQIEEHLGDEGRLIDILSAVFPEEEPLPVDDEVVQNQYLKTLCILLSIGGAGYIRHFVEHDGLADVRLPHTSKPQNFPISPSRLNLWDLFYEKQWVFCAAEMSYKINNSLEPHRILPIVEREVLGRGGSAVVSKIVLHKSFNKLRSNSASSDSTADNDTFVLKTYHKHEAEQYYHDEVEAFRRLRPLRGTLDPNIVHFYGSFTQNGTYNVILAFADKGTLEEYFRTVLPPTSGKDIEHFWTTLCGITRALVHIHEVDSQNTLGAPQIFQGWHQDVKPDNILVMTNGINSPYDWKFNLADLGTSHFKKWSKEGSDIDTRGTEAYGAPECFRADRFLEDCTIMVKQNCDIWSFGCILAEAAVWLIHGFPGLQRFRRNRSAAISAIPEMKNGDWFHDGTRVLPIVMETINSLQSDFRKSDRVTGPILEKLVKVMLDEPEVRYTAKQAHTHAMRILLSPSIAGPPAASHSPQGSDSGRLAPGSLSVLNQQDGNMSNVNIASSNISTPEHRTSVTVPSRSSIAGDRSPTRLGSSTSYVPPKRGHTQPNKSSQPELPRLDVDVAERWIRDKRAGRPRRLPGEYLLKRLATRDHVFLIDDAASMKAHKVEVKRILDLLAYLVKDSDPDGIELYFTCSKQQIKAKEPSKLVARFENNQPAGLTDIRTRLTAVIDDFIKGLGRGWLKRKFKPVRSLNIYVLTDGIWQPTTDLTSPIRRLVEKLNELENGQYQVGIQFISFGNRDFALERLNQLDDDLGEKLGRDIIDHEKYNGNVWKMLFGSTDPWFDGSKPSQPP
ncbi:kinase-like protein [Mollisia scopiformis]|uniref:Kinase-like protein n=1 Tax=Mollisia scopiformis TaxID=149040 RepID=A0A194XAD9_MOLSC|nr:kinase-like protein [Mollisia scopiformis]KUJ17135.1 kinase-like protein [Mollisia scopiformis]